MVAGGWPSRTCVARASLKTPRSAMGDGSQWAAPATWVRSVEIRCTANVSFSGGSHTGLRSVEISCTANHNVSFSGGSHTSLRSVELSCTANVNFSVEISCTANVNFSVELSCTADVNFSGGSHAAFFHSAASGSRRGDGATPCANHLRSRCLAGG